MKKALIILSIVAALLIVGFCLFYFVWTPQNMNAWGDSAMKDGRVDNAVSWYERAVDAAPGHEKYVLDLVDANVAAGNFTQAERNLVKAINTFDFSRECAFSTYAVPLIMGEIRRFLRDDGPIKVSREEKKIFEFLRSEMLR